MFESFSRHVVYDFMIAGYTIMVPAGTKLSFSNTNTS